MHQKVFFLELNEFNQDLLIKSSKDLSLKNLEKLVSLNKMRTFTEDTYDSDFLEPWVQWVTVHTGSPSTHHQIKHLGDVPHLGTEQVWEALSKKGISSGIWGAMNASRGYAENCLFFLPDPWTVSEQGYPHELNALLDPIRYVSQNYLNRSTSIVVKKVIGLLKLIFKNGLGWRLLKEIPLLIKNVIRYKAKSFVFISFADYLSTLLFLKYKKRFNPDFSLIFLNSLAHLQHHHWKDVDPIKNEPIVYGLKMLDRILGEIFSAIGEKEVLLVANALSQKNTSEEEPWILYRQVDQSGFLHAIGIKYAKVESLMTHDAHIFFDHEHDTAIAKEKLASIEILGKKLFLVEEYPQDKTKLFYRICFTDAVFDNTPFIVGGKEIQFFDLFQKVVTRTGKHIPEGTVFFNQGKQFSQIKNHEIFHWILDLFATAK